MRGILFGWFHVYRERKNEATAEFENRKMRPTKLQVTKDKKKSQLTHFFLFLFFFYF
jgi:hypothetical protein